MNSYLEYRFSGFSETFRAEMLIALLDKQGFLGFIEEGEGIIAYINACEKDSVDLEDIVRSGEISFSCSSIPEINWNAKWESDYKPVTLSDEVIIRAPFHKLGSDFQYDIIIEPKMSFGTGHHATTRLMLQHMSGIEFKKKQVLDIGCGTGVLSIYAAMLGASSVIAVDIDHWAYENTLENIERNSVERVDAVLGDVRVAPDKAYDIVLANINKNVLLEELHTYCTLIIVGGIIVISGILDTDFDVIDKEAITSSLVLQSKIIEQHWLSIVYKLE